MWHATWQKLHSQQLPHGKNNAKSDRKWANFNVQEEPDVKDADDEEKDEDDYEEKDDDKRVVEEGN
ncbi:hypothetical protein MTR_4g103390 [Medicago truncatula]|uniref:Uncharacterized protein n=1 Tax=Medicago truncatula TaxID=3880 RepID=G7JLD1_MEDTR|nr:hypothetical protein MTR_4g103390 [Medicago truncatula]